MQGGGARITHSSILDSFLLSTVLNQQQPTRTLEQSPNYVHDYEFQNFIDSVQPMVHTNKGFMFIALDKDFYEPGEMVKGSVFFDLFQKCP